MPERPEFAEKISPEDVAGLLSDLVTIPSVNPLERDTWAPPYGEAAIGDYLERYGRSLELAVERQPVLPGRDNVLVRLPGATTAPPLLLECHLDTVPGWDGAPDPFEPRVAQGRLYGRGACDVKGTLAAMLLALRLVRETGERPARGVVLAATVDEEHRARGVRALVQRGEAFAAAVVGEPTELAIVVAHKGCVRWQLTTRGRSVHSSKAELGQNAVEDMIDLLAALRGSLVPRLNERRHALLGAPSLTVGPLHGGSVVNVVPDLCRAEIDRRLVPGETVEGADAEFRAAVAEAAERVAGAQVEVSAPFVGESALETPAGAPIVRELAAAITRSGEVARQIGVPYGTDASTLHGSGVPAVVFGPGSIDVAHTRDEFVALSEVAQAGRILANLIVHPLE